MQWTAPSVGLSQPVQNGCGLACGELLPNLCETLVLAPAWLSSSYSRPAHLSQPRNNNSQSFRCPPPSWCLPLRKPVRPPTAISSACTRVLPTGLAAVRHSNLESIFSMLVSCLSSAPPPPNDPLNCVCVEDICHLANGSYRDPLPQPPSGAGLAHCSRGLLALMSSGLWLLAEGARSWWSPTLCPLGLCLLYPRSLSALPSS